MRTYYATSAGQNTVTIVGRGYDDGAWTLRDYDGRAVGIRSTDASLQAAELARAREHIVAAAARS